MKQQTGQIWATLLRAGLVQGNVPETTETTETDSPWYVKALLAFSGWLAALFLLGFVGVGLQFIIESSFASLITGSLMICGAFAILRLPKNEFIEHLGLAVSLAGQALVVWAIFNFMNSADEVAWVLVALVQMTLTVVIPNFVHRVFSSYFASFSFFMALVSMRWPYIFSSVVMFFSAWLWLNEFRYPYYMKKIRAIGYGLVLALVTINGLSLFNLRTLGWRSTESQLTFLAQPRVSEILAGAVMLYVVSQLLFRRKQDLTGYFSITVLLGTVLLSVVSLEARGITVGMMIILLGFNGGNRVLTGLGITSLLFYISAYYYQLDLTLLAKSQTLLIVGLVLLTVRWLLLRIMPGEEETKHVS